MRPGTAKQILKRLLKSKIFTFWLFKKKFADALLREVRDLMCHVLSGICFK